MQIGQLKIGLFIYILHIFIIIIICLCADRTAEDRVEVGAGPVASVQGIVGGDQRIPDGRTMLGVSLPATQRIAGGRATAGDQSTGGSPSINQSINQPINLPISQSINQSVNQPINQ